MSNLPARPTDLNERRQMNTAGRALSRAVPLLLDIVDGRTTTVTRALAWRLLSDLGILDPVYQEPRLTRDLREKK